VLVEECPDVPAGDHHRSLTSQPAAQADPDLLADPKSSVCSWQASQVVTRPSGNVVAKVS